MATVCPYCVCHADALAHRLLALLAEDDWDAALRAGLLDALPCPGCTARCNAALLAARDARRDALAARERYRARGQRLARIQDERAAARAPLKSAATSAAAGPAALPSAASTALARALAKARERRP